jgi:hypothetical protein
LVSGVAARYKGVPSEGLLNDKPVCAGGKGRYTLVVSVAALRSSLWRRPNRRPGGKEKAIVL